MEARKAFAIIITTIMASSAEANPEIEWSSNHIAPRLEYSRIDIPSDCSARGFDHVVDLPPGNTLDLADWFKPGTVWKMRVVGEDTVSQSICVIIGEDHFYYLGIGTIKF